MPRRVSITVQVLVEDDADVDQVAERLFDELSADYEHQYPEIVEVENFEWRSDDD